MPVSAVETEVRNRRLLGRRSVEQRRARPGGLHWTACCGVTTWSWSSWSWSSTRARYGARMEINSDFSDLLSLLGRHRVRYLVVGGWAVVPVAPRPRES